MPSAWFHTRSTAAALLALALAGCTAVPVNVGNPIPGMTTVAVAPFFNLSAEPTVDSRRFAIAYYSELQKTSNYQVVPVGIVETAIRENDLDLGSPEDAVKLAGILHVDAVVVGAVTEYVPYYPPQLGVQINWYSPRGWLFCAGAAPATPADAQNGDSARPPSPESPAQVLPISRGQSPDDDVDDRYTPFPMPQATKVAQGPRPGASGVASTTNPWPLEAEGAGADSRASCGPRQAPNAANGGFCSPAEPDSIQPVMSYTRFFDGARSSDIQLLKGYYALRGDMRSGGWQAYLHRSDDFLRFASNVLIVEMLSLHGGPLTTEKVLLFGK